MALIGAALLFLGFSVYIQFVSANATDKNWLLTAARKWLSGRQLYTDIFEVNPPLIVWIYSLPVWLSVHIGFLSDANFLALMGMGAIALVIALCDRMLAAHTAFTKHPGKRMCFALLLAYVFVFFTAPMYFFDREHILLVLTFPYMLRFSPGLARVPFPRGLRFVIGLLAAVGFCIKPHTLVIFGLLQFLILRRERSLAAVVNLENGIVCGVGLLYSGVIVFLMPEYLHTVIPMALTTYSAYSRKANGVFSIVICAAMLGLALADFRPRHKTPYRATVYYFLGLCLAYLLYALLNNGWSYTYQPLISMVRITAGWVLLEFLWLREQAKREGLPQKPFLFGARSSAAVLLLNFGFFMLFMVSYLLPVDCSQSLSCQATGRFFTQVKAIPARSFGSMSLEFYKWSELSRETGQTWDTRFNHLWMLPKFVLSGPEFKIKHQDILNYVGKAYGEDMERWKPDVMYIDISPEFFKGHGSEDLLSLFNFMPPFARAWSRYRLETVIDSCQHAPSGQVLTKAVLSDCRFAVYRRKTGE